MDAPQKPTLKYLSKRLGLGVSTVSQVLNNKDFRCAPETRRRVLAMAEELNYRPNVAARSLRNQRTHTIGLVAAGLAMELDVIELVCWKAGYTLSVTATHYNLEKQSEILRQLRQKHVDGMVLMDPLPDDPAIQELLEEHYPLVIVDAWDSYHQVSTFINDTEAGVRHAVEYLGELGHRRIAAVFADSPLPHSRLRNRGWREGVQQLGGQVCEDWYIPLAAKDLHADNYDSAYEAGEEFMRRFSRNDPDRPTAVYASADEVAVGLIKAFLEGGWTVPDDISIIGTNASAVGKHCVVPVTSVDVQHIRCRTEAVEHLLAILNEEAELHPPVKRRFAPKLVVRASTAPVG